MAINKSRKVPLARREFRVEMQQRDGDSGSADDRPMCPIQYGSQRAHHPEHPSQHRLSDVIENMYVALPVFIAHVAGRPATASQIARTLEMPRNTAVRKLDWLTRQGYITRRGAKRRSEICPFWTISLDVAFVTNSYFLRSHRP